MYTITMKFYSQQLTYEITVKRSVANMGLGESLTCTRDNLPAKLHELSEDLNTNWVYIYLRKEELAQVVNNTWVKNTATQVQRVEDILKSVLKEIYTDTHNANLKICVVVPGNTDTYVDNITNKSYSRTGPSASWRYFEEIRLYEQCDL